MMAMTTSSSTNVNPRARNFWFAPSWSRDRTVIHIISGGWRRTLSLFWSVTNLLAAAGEVDGGADEDEGAAEDGVDEAGFAGGEVGAVGGDVVVDCDG